MKKQSKSIDEDCVVNQLAKKVNEYFSKSPIKKHYFKQELLMLKKIIIILEQVLI